MSANVSLPTPRGTGTSGYVQRNLSVLRPRDSGSGAPYPPNTSSARQHQYQRQPDQDILQHDRLREIELAVLEHQEKLEDEGKLSEEEIEKECDALRAKLIKGLDRPGKAGAKGPGKKTKIHQVHELAEAKIHESERLRRALGLGKVADGEDGVHPMARQDDRRKQQQQQREEYEGQQGERERRGERRVEEVEDEDERWDERSERDERRR